ncbi:conserved hypothetical protein, membrane [Beggiatoa sp. PS]|nr:conserved hypothetical protein, membrane [Beggiatoa sp. PS]
MPLLALTILFWAIALAITLFSFFPKKYSVMPNVVSWKEKRGSADSLTIKEFYEKSADDKRNYLIASSISFFLGIICAGLTVII